MKNRIFFMVGNIEDAKIVVEDLRSEDFDDSSIHVIAAESIAMEPLPEADIAHTSDLIGAARRGAVTGGSMGLIGGVAAMTFPVAGLTLGGGALLAGTALGTALGTWFSTLVGVSVPNQEVERYRERIDAGEIMIIVDVEDDEADTVQNLVGKRYPDLVLTRGEIEAA